MEKYENVERPLNREAIREFEEWLGIKLPADFIEFYLANNGGNPPFYYVEGEEHVFALDGFFPIKYGSLTIEQLLKDYEKQDIAIKGRIPFASDPGGNVFCLSTSPTEKGSIYILPSESNPSDNDSYQYVCKSFAAFLAGMTNEPEENG